MSLGDEYRSQLRAMIEKSERLIDVLVVAQSFVTDLKADALILGLQDSNNLVMAQMVQTNEMMEQNLVKSFIIVKTYKDVIEGYLRRLGG